MSLVDDVFGSIPAPLIDQWEIDATYIKASKNQSYDPATGTVLGVAAEIPVRIVLLNVRFEEIEDSYQLSDVKILIAASSLGSYYPQITDSIRFLQDGVQRTAKILGKPEIGMSSFAYRGDNPIMHIVYARLG